MGKLILASVAVIALVACGGGSVEASDPRPTRVIGTPDHPQLRVWTDPETGCQYFLFISYDKGGIQPRLDEYGKPMCPRSGS